jgi:hypothetical protein
MRPFSAPGIRDAHRPTLQAASAFKCIRAIPRTPMLLAASVNAVFFGCSNGARKVNEV